MYIPSHFLVNDREKITAFMRNFNFAILVSAQNNIPEATHLPFITEEHGDDIKLVSHMAKLNPQNDRLITCPELLVIFNEPHAYISPKHYESEVNVPTWNYAAVHAYGKATVLESEEQKIETLEKMISFYEKDYMSQWRNLPKQYVSGMLKEIVAFEIHVTRIEAKHKLSQNKTKKERENIIETLQKSDDSSKRTIAEMMKGKL